MSSQVSKSMPIPKDQVNQIVEMILEKTQKIIDKTLLPNIIEKLNRHEKILVKGNGKPALVDSALIHTEKLTNIEKSVSEFTRFMMESRVKDQKLTDHILGMEITFSKELKALTASVGSLTGKVSKTEDWRKGVTAKTVAFIAGAGVVGGGLTWLVEHFDSIKKLFGN